MLLKQKDTELKWLGLAVLALIFAGIFAIGVAAPRVPFLHAFMEPLPFYRSIVTHVDFSMIIWVQAFIIGLWYIYTGKRSFLISRFGYRAVLLTILIIASLGFFDSGTACLNNYVPVIDNPAFWVAMILFWSVLALETVTRLPLVWQLFRRSTEEFLIGISLIITVAMLAGIVLSFAFIHIPYSDLKEHYERMFWIPGHIQQFLNACIMLVGWHFLVRFSRGEGAVLPNSRILQLANGLFLVFSIPMLSGIMLDPLSYNFKLYTTICYGVGLGVPVLIHTLYLLPKVKIASVAGSAFLLSAILYYAGVTIAYMGMKSDLRITAHYHGVVSALTVALMGMSYFILKEKKILAMDKMARYQPLVYTTGMLLVVAGLYLAGKLGAPRKTYGFNWNADEDIIQRLNLMGIGAAMSMSGGVMFVVYASVSLIRYFSWKRALVPAGLATLFVLFCSFNLPDEDKFLGKQVPDVQVTDQDGNRKSIRELLKGDKPIVISPVYTRCPSSCSIITGGLKGSVSELGTLGQDFSIITFSFDPNDSPDDLRTFQKRWNIDGKDWKVISSDEEGVKQLLASLDFQVDYDSAMNEYAHPNLVIVLTPSGKISRYVYGISPKPNDLRLSLLEAKKENTSLGLFEGIFLRCFRFDPGSRTYSAEWGFILQLMAGIIFFTIMFTYVARMFWKRKKRLTVMLRH
ncbi:MAG: SCO family protein [Bacteroidota bacterium]